MYIPKHIDGDVGSKSWKSNGVSMWEYDSSMKETKDWWWLNKNNKFTILLYLPIYLP